MECYKELDRINTTAEEKLTSEGKGQGKQIQIASNNIVLIHPSFTTLIKRISILHPPTPRYNFIWDVDQVLNHWKTYAPSLKISVKLSSLKLSMLLALAVIQR